MKKGTIIYLLLISSIFSRSIAQIDYDIVPDVTSTFLINDVHIQKTPTDSFGLGDILIEDGYIKQIAKEITAPNNAQIIEADSAYAYSAFIAGLSHTGLEKPERNRDRPKVKFPGNPPNNIAGITPEQNVVDLITIKEPSIKAMRESGFAISHVVPYGRMLPGTGAIISLNGKTAEDLVLKENTSMYFQLQGSRGFFPSTVIGVMAKWRDLYQNAALLTKHQETYKTNAVGTKRPKANKSLEALIPVTQKKMPVFMKAEKAKDIFRGLELQKELGYNLIITDVKQLTPALSKIKSKRIGVLLTPTVPKKEDAKKDKKGGKGKGKKGKKNDSDSKEKPDKGKSAKKSKKGKSKVKEKEDDPETKALKERKKKSYDTYIGQAASLEKENIPFAFSFTNAKVKELKKNINIMIEAGMSQSAALAALTTNPAKLLGIDKIAGTLSPGKFANIVISNKPYFNKESAIKYIFVEGHMTELEVKEETKKEGDKEINEDIPGRWSYEIDTPMGIQKGEIIISSDGKVEMSNEESGDEVLLIEDAAFDGSTLTFSMTRNIMDNEMNLDYNLELSDDSLSGSVSVGEWGAYDMTGSKISSPE